MALGLCLLVHVSTFLLRLSFGRVTHRDRSIHMERVWAGRQAGSTMHALEIE